MLHFSAMFLATGLLASPGAAVQPVQLALEQVRQFPAYQEAIAKIYQDYEGGLATHCGAIDLDSATGHAHVVVPLKLDASGNIVSGIWTEQTNGVACGEKRRYSALSIFEQGKPYLFSLWPGESYSSPVLQRDAMTTVSGAIAAAGGTCPADIVNSALPHGVPEGKATAWVEEWTVRSCEKRFVVTMHFTPDATGTGFSLSPKDVVALPSEPAGKGS